jgi:hypothetical protein
MFINSIKYEIILNPQRRTGLHSCSPPNQSLKLTEVAVDDLTRAKQTVTIGLDIPRADWIPSLRHFVAAA